MGPQAPATTDMSDALLRGKSKKSVTLPAQVILVFILSCYGSPGAFAELRLDWIRTVMVALRSLLLDLQQEPRHTGLLMPKKAHIAQICFPEGAICQVLRNENGAGCS